MIFRTLRPLRREPHSDLMTIYLLDLELSPPLHSQTANPGRLALL